MSFWKRAVRQPLIEARVWASFVDRITGGSKRPLAENAFTYQRYIRPVLKGALWLVAVEGVIVDAMLFAVLGNSVWAWLGLAVHVYALIWIAGVLGSLHTYPHVLEPDRIILRDSVFREIAIPLTAVRSVQRIHEPVKPRTGYRFDSETRSAVFAYGNATVKIVLDEREAGLAAIKITADDPARFVSELQLVRRSAPSGSA